MIGTQALASESFPFSGVRASPKQQQAKSLPLPLVVMVTHETLPHPVGRGAGWQIPDGLTGWQGGDSVVSDGKPAVLT